MLLRKKYQAGTVTIRKYMVDLDRLSEDTSNRIFQYIEEPGRYYVNPEYSVQASPQTTSHEFVKHCRRALGLWNARLSRILGACERKRQIKKASKMQRLLEFTGVQIINGKIIEPHQW